MGHGGHRSASGPPESLLAGAPSERRAWGTLLEADGLPTLPSGGALASTGTTGGEALSPGPGPELGPLGQGPAGSVEPWLAGAWLAVGAVESCGGWPPSNGAMGEIMVPASRPKGDRCGAAAGPAAGASRSRSPESGHCWGRGPRALSTRPSRRSLSSLDARLGASAVSCGRKVCSFLQSCPGSLVFALKAPLPLAHPMKGRCLE